MIEQSITIVNKLGLHARAAAKFVTTASAFTSTIQVARNGRIVNGKSIMGLMMLAAGKGSKLTIRTEGPVADAEKMLLDLEDLFARRFEEA